MGRPLHRVPARSTGGGGDGARPATTLVGIDAIRAAGRTLVGSSPVRRSCRSGRPTALFLKAESLQPIGAFKIRGAYNAIASLTAERASARRHHLLVGQPRPGRRPGGSPARHAGGRRDAGRRAGDQARPRRGATAPRSSSSGRRRDERQARAEQIAAERGLAIIPPFDDDRIIAGQGTVGSRDRRGPAGCRSSSSCRSVAVGWRVASRPP